MFLMCGPAGSGKSTYARRLEDQGFVRLSLDVQAWDLGHQVHPLPEEVAEPIRARIKARLVELAAAGRDVVVDLSFWSMAARQEYRDLLAPLGVVPIMVVMRTPPETIRQRLAARSGSGPDEILLTPQVTEQHLAGFQWPTGDEGPLLVVTAIPGDS